MSTVNKLRKISVEYFLFFHKEKLQFQKSEMCTDFGIENENCKGVWTWQFQFEWNALKMQCDQINVEFTPKEAKCNGNSQLTCPNKRIACIFNFLPLLFHFIRSNEVVWRQNIEQPKNHKWTTQTTKWRKITKV